MNSSAKPAPEFADKPFRSEERQVARFADFIAETIAASPLPGPRILDIGCGDGSLLARLSELLPESRGTGIDVSCVGIAAARARSREGATAAIQYIESDYMTHALPVQDMIVSLSTLQLIPAPDEELFAKISRELKPQGLLIIDLPYDCAANRILNIARGWLRRARCRAVEAAVLWTARRLHGGEYPDAVLRDRVAYSFIVIKRLFSEDLRERLERRWGLRMLRQRRESPVLGKLAHAYVALRKVN